VAVRPRRSLRQNWLRVGNAVFAGGLRLNFLRKGMRVLAIVRRPRTRCSICDAAARTKEASQCRPRRCWFPCNCLPLLNDRKRRIRNRRFNRNSFLSDRERSRVDPRNDRTASSTLSYFRPFARNASQLKIYYFRFFDCVTENIFRTKFLIELISTMHFSD